MSATTSEASVFEGQLVCLGPASHLNLNKDYEQHLLGIWSKWCLEPIPT